MGIDTLSFIGCKFHISIPKVACYYFLMGRVAQHFIVVACLVSITVSQSRADTVSDDTNVYTVQPAPLKEVMVLPAFFTHIFVHELGHVITPLLFAGYPTSFKPYPYMKNGKIQFGSASWWIPNGFVGVGDTITLLMGVGGEMLAAYFAAPYISQVSNGYLREYIRLSCYIAATWFPWYIVSDLIFNNGPDISDFARLRQNLGIHQAWFLVPAIISSYFLLKHIYSFDHRRPPDSFIISVAPLPVMSLPGTSVQLLGKKHAPGKFALALDPVGGAAGLALTQGF